MLETDRDLYLDFARAMSLDFDYVRRLIDGEVNSGPALAESLGYFTSAHPCVWRRDGMAPTRLMAVKVWAVRERRAGRLAWIAGPDG